MIDLPLNLDLVIYSSDSETMLVSCLSWLEYSGIGLILLKADYVLENVFFISGSLSYLIGIGILAICIG